MNRLASLITVVACLLAPQAIEAIQQPEHDRAPLPLERAQVRMEPGSAWQQMQITSGGGWHVRADALTGLPGVARGRLPWVPGTANHLGADKALADRFAADPVAILAERGLAFVDLHPGLFGVPSEALALNPLKTAGALRGRVWFLGFDYLPHGIPVEGAQVFFRVNQGNLVQFGTALLLPPDGLDPAPRVAAESASLAAATRLGPLASPRAGAVPALVWIPMEEAGALAYRLAWRVELERPDDVASWQAWVDARSGEVLGIEDGNHYACPPEVLALGRVTGGVRPIDFYDDEAIRPLAHVSVGGVAADGNGLWSHPGGDANGTVGGPYAWTTCIGCQNPSDPVPLVTADPGGDVSFGMGGDNHIGNGISNRAARTAYYHVMRARTMAEQWLAGNTYLERQIDIAVNINSACNAYYTSSTVNFYRKAGACNNMGEIPGVVHHEWGHGLDEFTGGFVGDRSEGFADHIAWISSHDPRIGPGFVVNGNPVRNVDSTVVGIKRYNQCGGGAWVYCVGEVWSQADWEMTLDFRTMFGDQTGWRLYETIFFSSLWGFDNINPNWAAPVYEAYAVVMDDDGDLGDGEIHFADILNSRYQTHRIAPGGADQYKDAGNPCDPVPDAPVPTFTVQASSTTGRAEVVVDWTAVPGAKGYEVLRNQEGTRESLIRVGETVAETTFTDTGLVQGATYHYAIMPIMDHPLCLARISGLASVTVDIVQLSLENVAMGGPGGADGVWLPGETVDLLPTIRNTSGAWVPPGATADNVTATLVPADFEPIPLVDLVDVGTLAPDQSLPALDPWVVELPDDLSLCGKTLRFQAAMEADQGCWDDVFTVTVGSGGSDVVVDNIIIDDSGPGANANGVLEPEETGLLRPVLLNRGLVDATGVVLELSALDPRLSLSPPGMSYGTIPAGGSVTPPEGFQISFDDRVFCGDRPTLFINIRGDNGCWRDQFRMEVLQRLILVSDNIERPATGWTVSGGAAAGQWVQTNPIGTGLQPENDTTPAPGILAWVTGNPPGAPDEGDVDGGCTVLTSPVWDLGGVAGAALEYQRFYTLEGVEDDELRIEISNNGGGSWQELETITRTQGWRPALFDLDTELGDDARQLRLRVTACDNGSETLVEAGIDDITVSFRGCEPPDMRPELVAARWTVDDGIVAGSGDGDGVAEPGETLELRISLENVRNGEARAVAGTLSLESPIADVSILQADSPWPDIAAGGSGVNGAPRFLVELDPALACGTQIPLSLSVDYEGGDPGSPTLYTTVSRTDLLVGFPAPGNGPEEVLFADNMDGGGGEGPWMHADLWNADDWERGDPFGLEGDPLDAFSPPNVWGTSIGAMGNQGVPTGGPYTDSSACFLESWPVDLSAHGQTILEFRRWLTLAPGDEARVLVGGQQVWAAPPAGITDTEWVRPRIDVSAVADMREDVTVRFELESDGAGTAGGWNLDDIRLTAIPIEMICDSSDCNSIEVPDPVGRRHLFLEWADRAAGEVRLRWDAYQGNALQFRVYRASDAAELPPGTGAAFQADVAGPSWIDAGPASGLRFYEVTALNPCGVEEEQ